MRQHRDFRGYALIFGATFFWALAGSVAKFLFTSKPIDPLALVGIRMLLGALTLTLLLSVVDSSKLHIKRKDLGYFSIYGVFGMAAVQLTYFTAVSQGSVSTAIFLQYLAPLLTAVYFSVLSKRLPEQRVVWSLVIAVMGSGLLLLGGGRGLSTTPLGLFAGLASAGFMSFYAVYGVRGVKEYPAQTVLLWSMGIGALFIAVVSPPWRLLSMNLGPQEWGFVVYMSVFGAVVPFFMFLEGLKSVPALQAVLLCMLEPVLATLFAWIFLSESLNMLQLAGGALIITAVVVVETKRQLPNTRSLSAPGVSPKPGVNAQEDVSL